MLDKPNQTKTKPNPNNRSAKVKQSGIIVTKEMALKKQCKENWMPVSECG
jgi:hypothetical protein